MISFLPVAALDRKRVLGFLLDDLHPPDNERPSTALYCRGEFDYYRAKIDYYRAKTRSFARRSRE